MFTWNISSIALSVSRLREWRRKVTYSFQSIRACSIEELVQVVTIDTWIREMPYLNFGFRLE
jgi:hypothetical protein